MIPNNQPRFSTSTGYHPTGRAEVRALPSQVRRAVQAMYVGAVLGTIGIAASAFMTKATSLPRVVPGTNPNTTAYAAGAAVGGLLFAALVAAMWIWMAWAIKRGRNWARILSCVLFGFGVLRMLLGFISSAASVGTICWTLSVIAGLATIIMLFQPASNAYFSPAAPMPYPLGYGSQPGYGNQHGYGNAPGYGYPPGYGNPGDYGYTAPPPSPPTLPPPDSPPARPAPPR